MPYGTVYPPTPASGTGPIPMISSKASFAYTKPPSGAEATQTPQGRPSAMEAMSASSSGDRMDGREYAVGVGKARPCFCVYMARSR